MSEPRDMIIPMLQEIRAGILALTEKVERFQGEARVEFTKLDARHKAMRQAMGTDSLMSKFILGDFEERLALVEQRLENLGPAGAK